MVHTTYDDYLALLCVKATASLILLFLSHVNVLKNVLKIMVSQIDNQQGGGNGGEGGVWGKGGSGGGRVVKSLISSGYRSIVYIIADDSDQLQRMKY